MTMCQYGRVVRWVAERGFGFIAPEQGGDEVFVHVSDLSGFGNDLPRGWVPPAEVRVSYRLAQDARGRRRAEAVVCASGARGGQASRMTAGRARRGTEAALRGDGALWGLLMLGLAALAAIFGLAATHRLDMKLAALLGLLSALTFVAYGSDKAAALGQRWRTQEKTLHLLALLGGWPGALLAQALFRHKYRKASFLARFWGTVALNVSTLGLWLAQGPHLFFG